MVITNQKIESFTENTRITLESLKKDSVIKAKAFEYGYTDERLDDGLELNTDLNDTYDKLLTARGIQLKISVSLREKFDEASQGFSFFYEILRTAFTGSPELIKELGLEGGRKRRINPFIAQAYNFYNNILNKPHILEKIAEFLITPEKIQAEMTLIEELKALHLEHATAQGECQRLTEDRDRKLLRMRRFMRQLRRVLYRQYEEGSRQILERVNIFVRNRRKPKPKPAPDDTQPEDNTEEQETTQETPEETA